MIVFQEDSSREVLIFPPSLDPSHRLLIHTLAHHMGLQHTSRGSGEYRQVHVTRQTAKESSPPLPQYPLYSNESQRRGLNRAATTDFSEARGSDPNYYHTLGRQGSGLLDIPGSPGGGGLSAAQNLRGAKSFADLRSYTPSPVHSTASFPSNLRDNVANYRDYINPTSSSLMPNMTATSSSAQINGRDESYLLNGLSSLSLGGFPRNNGRETRSNLDAHSVAVGGAIGSQRSLNGNLNNLYEEQARDSTTTMPQRQPRGPGSEWGGSAFSRARQQTGHPGRGSGELDALSAFT